MKMLSKISIVVLAAALVSVLGAAGCKKEEKGGGGCEELGKKMKESGMAEMPKDVPADAKAAMEKMVDKSAGILVKRCKEDKWSADTIKCGTTSKDPKKECMGKLTADQQKNLQDDMLKAMSEGDMPAIRKDEPKDEPAPTEPAKEEPAAAPTEPAKEEAAAPPAEGTAAGTGLPSCDEYVALVEKYMACDKIPQETRDATKQGIDAMKQGWGDIGALPEETRKQMDDGCKQGVDALKQGASALGCAL
jgi:hypothetical protein